MVALPITGGCQCGALRYEITLAPRMVYNCHCTNCQKIGGGAFSTPIAVLEAAFRFVAGEPRVVEWASDAGNTRWGSFCGACGSRIGHGARPSNGVLSIRGGTLDDTSWVEPVADIWTRSAQPWMTLGEGRLKYDRQPSDYEPILGAFRAQGRFAS
jgi:hypothetical protein